MIPFTTYPYADISTAHVAKQDAKIITESGPEITGVISVYDRGWFCYIPNEAYWNSSSEEWVKSGMSNSYIHLQRKLMEAGISYARFDSDGETVIGLPRFDW